MKNKLMMILASVLMVVTCGFTQVMPAFATSGINSRGNMLFEGGDTAFYSADIESLNADVTGLSTELPAASYAKEQDMTMKNDIKSKGIIKYDSGKVIFDSSDLVKLADGINNLETGYKCEAVKALNTIGTYFKADGSVTYDKTSDVVAPENASILSFSDIITGVSKSQSVGHLADRSINPATENSLSKGSAAWVDGKLLIGNGNDNQAHYEQGYADGEASVPRAACYYIGSSSGVSDSSVVFNIKDRVPGVDHKQLTDASFIVCPYKVNGKGVYNPTTLSVSANVVYYSKLEETDISAAITYDAENGKLTIVKPIVISKGGLDSVSTMTATAKGEVDFKVYLITGEIINCN